MQKLFKVIKIEKYEVWKLKQRGKYTKAEFIMEMATFEEK